MKNYHATSQLCEVKSTQLINSIDELHTAWIRLASVQNANVSLLPDWTYITARAHNLLSITEVLSARENGRLTLVAPIVFLPSKSRYLPINTLGIVGNFMSYHNQVISSMSPDHVINILLNEAKNRNFDCLYLDGISDHSDFGVYLKDATSNSLFSKISEPSESCPFLPLDLSWEKLLEAKPKKFRYKIRKREEILETSGNIEMRWLRTQGDCLELLNSMRIIEENSWKKEAGHSIFDSDVETQYYNILLPYLASHDALLANVLIRDGIPIAYNLCCNWLGWVGQLKTSFDVRHADISPGSIVIDQAIKYSIESGAYEFDFLGDTDPHKLAWTKQIRTHTNYYLFLKSSWKGRLIGYLKKMRRKAHKPS